MFHIQKVIALPEILSASTLYIVKHENPELVDLYFTNEDGSENCHLLTKNEILNFLQDATSNLNTALIAANLTERNSLTLVSNTLVWVVDASEDSTVTLGSAAYIFQYATQTWIKITEVESLDQVLDWTEINGRPLSTPNQIDTGVNQRHSHGNSPLLDKIVENLNGKLMYGTHDLQSDIETLQATYNGKSDTNHTHAIAEFSGIQSTLDGKALNTHTHDGSEFPNLRDYFVNRPSIEAPAVVYAQFANRFPITNYDAFTVYNLSTSNGSISVVNGEVVYVPAVAGLGGFTINNNTVVCNVISYSLVTPSIISPVNGSTTVGKYVTFLSSAFAADPSILDTHLSSDWEIASDAGFTSILYSSYNDTVNKTSWYVEGFLTGTTYYIRVRHRGTLLTSAWSISQAFTTKTSFFGTNETTILTAFDLDQETNASFSVGIVLTGDGSRMAMGAHQLDVSGLANVGKVYVYRREGLNWILEAGLLPGVIQTTDVFGLAMCFDEGGTRLAVGCTGQDDATGPQRGAVYVFSRSGTVWGHEAMLLSPSSTGGNAQMGRGLAITRDGTRIVTGALWESTGSLLYHGRGYVFKRTGTTWTQEAIILASDKGNTDNLGLACGIDDTGTRLVISSYRADSGAFVDCGKVYVFTRSGSTWTQEAILTASDIATNSFFGRSAVINPTGDRIVIGASGASSGGVTSCGQVYTFTRVGTVWTQVNILTASVKGNTANFGVGVWLSPDSNLLLVGAYLEDAGGIADAGAVYVYLRSGNSWIEQTILSASDKVVNMRYGVFQTASDDGSIIAVSAYPADLNGIVGAGKAYVYT